MNSCAGTGRRPAPCGDCTIVIPARFASKRFPGKVLADLEGRSVVEWCYRAALRAGIGPVLVATDDRRVARAVEAFGGNAVLTGKRAVSGTDRVFQAFKSLARKTPYVINLQGDEPLISPSTLRNVAALLRRESRADIVTAVAPMKDARKAQESGVVKAVVSHDGRALYFSRAPIPADREMRNRLHRRSGPVWLEHRGIYGFKALALERFVRLKPSRLERAESLEQLRALEDGMNIFAVVDHGVSVSIDHPADIRKARLQIKANRGRNSRLHPKRKAGS